ncbi:hypothetical protein SBV1_1280022 [Verrucomicrobia bacterium]|nr:hypothetical protein SBV1_1280022 [Verrucomicrobiota bacterium]
MLCRFCQILGIFCRARGRRSESTYEVLTIGIRLRAQAKPKKIVPCQGAKTTRSLRPGRAAGSPLPAAERSGRS